MTTRSAKRLLLQENIKEITTEINETTVRRSPRNLPAHLKENLEKETVQEKEPSDISDLPSITFKGCIKYVNDFNDCAFICDDLIKQVEDYQAEIVPIGFDLEWPFSFQTGSGKTALAQICFNNSICYLLYLYELKKLPAAFILLLSHPKVKLVGVNIKNDIRKLGRDFKHFPAQKVVDNNCLDSGVFANQVLNRSCRWSLQRLTAYLLKKQISKDPKVRNSKWHIQPLSEEQKIYAATDAYVSWLLHTVIQERASNEDVKTNGV